MAILPFLSILSDFGWVFHRKTVPGQGQSPCICIKLEEWGYKYVACSSPFGEFLSFLEHAKFEYSILACSPKRVQI